MSNKYLEKITEQAEYSGPSYGAALGGSALGTAAGIGSVWHGANASGQAQLKYLKDSGLEHLVGTDKGWETLPNSIKKIGTKRLYGGLGLAGASALGGMAAIPAIAAYRQYQDYKSGNPESHYLRSALLGGVAGGLAPTKHLTVGRGALAGLGASAANQIYQHYKGTPSE